MHRTTTRATASTAAAATALMLAACSAWSQSTPATAATQPEEPSLPYVVRPSDKLIRLSRDLLADPRDWIKVARFNQMRDPNFVRPGQRLRIPISLMRAQPAALRVLSVAGSVQGGGAALTAGMPLAEGITIQTGVNSTAVLELGDGSRVKVLPQSLAEVVANRGYAMRDASGSASTTWYSGVLRLAHGSLETVAARLSSRATPLQIVTPTSVVGVRGTEFRVSHEAVGEGVSRTEVNQGEVRAENTRQAVGIALPGGFGVAVRPSQREMRQVALLASPELGDVPAQLTREPGGPLDVALTPLRGAVQYRALVALDDRFNAIVADLRVAQPVLDLRAVPAGDWYLLVRGVDAEGLQGFDAIRRVAIREVAAPAPPPAPPVPRVINSRLTHGASGASLSLDFDLPVAAPVGVTVGREATLAQPLLRADLAAAPGSTLALGQLTPGRYYVQLSTPLAGGARASSLHVLDISPNWGITVFDSSFVLQPVQR